MFAYDDWVRHVFDHRVTDPAWYWDVEADTREPEPPESVACLTRLFEEPEFLAQYSDGQVNQGFWYLVHNCCSNYTSSLIEPGVAWPERQRGIRAIAALFTRLFARRCSDHLSHVDEKGASPLNSACYMWWDLFPTWGQPEDPAAAELDAELLAVMSQILSIDSLPCQESALHGLGHWHMHYPARVQEIITGFLESGKEFRPELRHYAMCAAQGRVQ